MAATRRRPRRVSYTRTSYSSKSDNSVSTASVGSAGAQRVAVPARSSPGGRNFPPRDLIKRRDVNLHLGPKMDPWSRRVLWGKRLAKVLDNDRRPLTVNFFPRADFAKRRMEMISKWHARFLWRVLRHDSILSGACQTIHAPLECCAIAPSAQGRLLKKSPHASNAPAYPGDC